MNDILNAIFEMGGGFFILANIMALYKDKEFKGVRIIPTSFFAAWGMWNLYFYPSLGCWWSLWGGVLIVTMNLIWVGQMIYYRRVNRAGTQGE